VQPSASPLVYTLMVALFFIFLGSNSAPISVHFPLDADSCFIFKFLGTVDANG
jgi:hypothetical protein